MDIRKEMPVEDVALRERQGPELATLGFRVKSGKAVAVLLAGGQENPRVLDRTLVPLADPEDSDACQPYHAALDLPPREGAKVASRLVQGVKRYAERSLGTFIEGIRARGHLLLGIGIVTGSDVDPASIANDHIRAHALEGRLFRDVVEAAARKLRIPSRVLVEKALNATASQMLDRSSARLKADLTALGRGVVRPWRTEEKASALVAWIVLKDLALHQAVRRV